MAPNHQEQMNEDQEQMILLFMKLCNISYPEASQKIDKLIDSIAPNTPSATEVKENV